MKNVAIILGVLLVVLAIAFFVIGTKKAGTESGTATTTPSVLSFKDCLSAGYPVTGTSPRQCKTPEGLTYAEELPAPPPIYVHASADLIVIDLPFPGAVTGKEFKVTGKARGTWFFEASFPVEVLDRNGNILSTGIGQAQGEWMTENFVPFSADIKVPDTYQGPATLVLKKDNPSGMPENDASVSFPITIEY
ncbi:MAG: hypothetical protein JWN64_786 [Parcubacteria group bacterium]|nr:hypothetical protein [Parcubacteria group bacterium]